MVTRIPSSRRTVVLCTCRKATSTCGPHPTARGLRRPRPCVLVVLPAFPLRRPCLQPPESSKAVRPGAPLPPSHRRPRHGRFSRPPLPLLRAHDLVARRPVRASLLQTPGHSPRATPAPPRTPPLGATACSYSSKNLAGSEKISRKCPPICTLPIAIKNWSTMRLLTNHLFSLG